MVAEARWVTGPIAAPMIAMSVGSTYVTVTVTVVASTLTATSIGRSTSTARRCGRRAGIRRHRRSPSAFAGREFDGDLVADRHADLGDRQHRQHDDRERDGELDSRLPPIVDPSPGSARGRHVRPGRSPSR